MSEKEPNKSKGTKKDKAKEKEDEAKKIKKEIKLKMIEIIKMVDMEERFIISLRDKQRKDFVQDYPERTICGCDGEVYNMLMNWAYKHKMPNHLAFDHFVEAHGKGLDKIKQRPKSADRASMRYWRTNSKKGVLKKDQRKK